MNKIDFLKESLRNLKTVGTVTRSSPFLCKGMIKPVDFKKADVIIELGGGDGVVTKHILRAMKPDAKLLTFEVNGHFCNIIREIKDDRLHVIEDSAEHLEAHLKKHGIKKVDYIISLFLLFLSQTNFVIRLLAFVKKYFVQKGFLYRYIILY